MERGGSQAGLHHLEIGQKFRYGYDQAVDLGTVVEDHQPGRDEAHDHRRHLVHGGGHGVFHKASCAAQSGSSLLCIKRGDCIQYNKEG